MKSSKSFCARQAAVHECDTAAAAAARVGRSARSMPHAAAVLPSVACCTAGVCAARSVMCCMHVVCCIYCMLHGVHDCRMPHAAHCTPHASRCIINRLTRQSCSRGAPLLRFAAAQLYGWLPVCNTRRAAAPHGERRVDAVFEVEARVEPVFADVVLTEADVAASHKHTDDAAVDQCCARALTGCCLHCGGVFVRVRARVH